MNNFTKSSGNAYWHAITNLTCCNVDLKKMQLFKTFLVLMLFAFSSTSMFAQNRTTFYEVCVEDRPEGLTEEQALALFPDVNCEGTLSVEKIEDLQGGDCGWVSIYEYILRCDGEQVAIEKLIYEGGDLEAPKLEVPADITVECDAIPNPGTPTATDNCDDDVDITLVSEEIVGEDDCSYTIVRTWTATDECGLTDTKSQIITVLDTKGPELNKGAKVPTGETGMNVCYSDIPEGPTAEYIASLFSDNCGDVLVEKVPVFKGTDCMWKGYISYYITDDCGNPADTITLYYNGGDTEAPVFVDPPAENITVSCIDQIPTNYVLQWTDNCSVSDPKSKGLGVDDTTNLGEACEGGSMTRTWTAQDACGNEVTHTQTITVTPAPPVAFDEADEVIEIKCEELESFVPGTLGYSNGGSGACDISGTVQGVAEDFSDNCGTFTFTVTYTYEDTCNSIKFEQTINVIDDVAPVISGVGSGMLIECPDAIIFSEPTVSDNCDSAPSLTFVDKDDRDDCGLGEIQRTWTATDCAGNVSTATQTIKIEDNVAPVISGVGEPFTVECPEEYAFSEPTATDACDVNASLVSSDDYNLDNCGLGTITRTWTATDCAGNVSTASQTITIEDNAAPVITEVGGAMIIDCPAEPVFSEPKVSDTCDSAPSLTFLDDDKRDDCGLGNVTRTWTATDCAGNVSTASQTITIEDNAAPVISGVGEPFTVECTEDYAFSNPTATDACDANASLVPSDDYNLDNCGLGTITRTWTATDCAGNVSTASQTITIEDTTAPVISGVGSGMLIECPESPIFSQPTVSDNCDSAPSLTFVDKDDRDDCGLGEIQRTWTATDCAGNVSTATQTIKIEDNVAPVISGVGGPFTVECPDEYAFSEPTASDECSDAGFNAEDWIISEGYDGVITLTSSMLTIIGGDDGSGLYDDSYAVTTCPINGTYSFDWSYSTQDDPFFDFAYSVNGNLYYLSDIFGAQQQSGTLTLNCQAGDVIGWGVYSTDSLFGAATLEVTNYNAPGEGVSLTFEDTDTLDNCGLGTITRTWTATDCAGNSSQESQTITIEDNTAPEITEVGDPMTIDCPGQPEFSEPKVSDTCDAAPSLTFLDDDKRDECGLGEVTRTWTATDCAGNTSTASQTITVQDVTDPYFNENLPQDVTEECDAVTPAVILTASDTCDTDVKVDFNENTIPGDCPGRYTLVRTWTAVDCAGNDIEHVQTVTVVDTTAPVEGEGFELPLSINEINGCQDDYMTPPMTEEEFAAMFTDNCSNVVVSLFSSPVGNNCGWSIIHIYTVADDCGNILGDYKVYYSGEDLTNPELVGVPAGISIMCDEEIPAPADVTATDNCDSDVKAHLEESIVNYNCAGNYDIIRTWTATDDCGNTISDSQTIEVRDLEAPSLIDGAELPEGSNENDLCAPDTDEELANLGVLTAAEFELLYEDNCSGVNVNRVINLDGDDCKWIMWVRYDITDDCGNEAQSVKVWYHGADETAPEPTGLCTNEAMDIFTSDTGICPADATITYDSEISAEGGEITVGGMTFGYDNLKPCFMDNCATQEELTFVVTGTDEGDDKACPRTMTITFDVYDNCDNAYEGFVCTFIIIDDVAPVIDECPANIVAQPDLQDPGDKVGFTSLGLYNGKYYYLSDAAMPATQIFADAISNGGNVVKVEDDAENTFIWDAAYAANGNQALRFWIGLTDAANEGNFVWQDGTPLGGYENWYDGEPNNVGNGENCVELGRFDGSDEHPQDYYAWNDFPCDSAKRYILEVDATQGCGAVVTFDEPKASDNCDLVSFEQTAGLPSGSEFPIGTTTVTYTATDACGNTTECSFDVTVECETEAPQIECPSTEQNPIDFGHLAGDLGSQELFDNWIAAINSDVKVNLTDNCDDTRDAGWFSAGANGTIYPDGTVEWTGTVSYADIAHSLSVNGDNVDACGNYTQDYCVVYYVFTSTTSPSYSANNCAKLETLEDGTVVNGTCDNNQAQSAPDQGDDMGIELDFTAYPVPFDKDVNVKFNFEFDTDVTIEVHDTKGLLVKSLTLNNVRANSDVKKSFDLSRAGDQLFYITVTTNQGSVTKKVVSSNMKIRR